MAPTSNRPVSDRSPMSRTSGATASDPADGSVVASTLADGAVSAAVAQLRRAQLPQPLELVLDPSGDIACAPLALRAFAAVVGLHDLFPRLIAEGTGCATPEPSFSVDLRHVGDPEHPLFIARILLHEPPAPTAWDTLTPRQREVATLAAHGRNARDIGTALGCTLNTARSHLRTIYERLGVSNRIELAALARA